MASSLKPDVCPSLQRVSLKVQFTLHYAFLNSHIPISEAVSNANPNTFWDLKHIRHNNVLYEASQDEFVSNRWAIFFLLFWLKYLQRSPPVGQLCFKKSHDLFFCLIVDLFIFWCRKASRTPHTDVSVQCTCCARRSSSSTRRAASKPYFRPRKHIRPIELQTTSEWTENKERNRNRAAANQQDITTQWWDVGDAVRRTLFMQKDDKSFLRKKMRVVQTWKGSWGQREHADRAGDPGVSSGQIGWMTKPSPPKWELKILSWTIVAPQNDGRK